MREIRRIVNTKAIAAEHKECRAAVQQLTELELADQGRQWGIRNSPTSSYEKTFREVLPKGKGLTPYIEEKFADKAGSVVGIELGGTGSAFFEGFSEGFFEKTVGVALTDSRASFSPDPTERDTRRNHSVIAGDMIRHRTKTAVEEWLDGKEADIIVEKMEGGIIFLPDDPFFMAEEVQYWYQTLSDRGILLAEVPRAFREIIDQWQDLVAEEAPDLWVDVGRTSRDIVLLEKNPESPEKLPLLDINTVRTIIFEKEVAGENPLGAEFLIEDEV